MPYPIEFFDDEYRAGNVAPEPFRSWLAFQIYWNKYANGNTWEERCEIIARDVCGDILPENEILRLINYMTEMKFIPGGRYMYYGGRDLKAFNNCFCFKGKEDTREEWSRLVHDAMSCLMMGGGIGIDYSVFRAEGYTLSRTGGIASGPLSLMKIMNETGRYVMQGGSRRSALYASLHWQHGDIFKFIRSKNWSEFVRRQKEEDFNYAADLDMTNISVNVDDEFFDALADPANELHQLASDVLDAVCQNMLRSAEPGLSFNMGDEKEFTARNACAEFISEDDSDVCNLGSANMSRIETLDEMLDVCYLASRFLYCGGIKADLPTDAVRETRKKNMSIGLGIMGVHEWLLKRGKKYEMDYDLEEWLRAYKRASEIGANDLADKLGMTKPKRYRAIAPTGTIGLIAGTSTGIEPVFAVAYKRRYLVKGTEWKEQYFIDSTADLLIKTHGLRPSTVESAMDLAQDPERRIKFQADVQKYVDMGISSTLNLPAFDDQTFTVSEFKELIKKYGPQLRGLTVYPDGCRGGQPLTPVPYGMAALRQGVEYDANAEVCKGGLCGE